MEFVISIFGIGFLGHFLEGPTRKWFPISDNGDDSVNRLMSYVEGGCFILLAFMALALAFLPRKTAWQAISFLCASEVGVGAGVALGYVADGVMRQ